MAKAPQYPSLRPLTRAWLNRQIENPVILYPLLGLVVLVTLLVVFRGIGSARKNEDREIAVPAKTPPVKRTVASKELEVVRPEQPRQPIERIPAPQTSAASHEPVSPAKLDSAPVESTPAKTPPVETMVTVRPEPVSTKPVETKTLSPEESLGLRAVSGGRYATMKLDEVRTPLEFVKFEPGEFRFGVPQADLQAGEFASQACRIEQPFLLSTTEVTNRQYDVFARAVGDETAGLGWRQAWNGNPVKDDFPVVDVSLPQARAFCQWLGGRLPTEREWERAARGSAGRATPWEVGPVDATRCRLRFSEGSTLVKVSELAEGAGPDGLLHLLGNVAEWCDDVYAPGHLEESADPGVGRWNVVRGGSYLDPPPRTRVTSRTNCPPAGASYVGFRVAMTLPASK